LRQEIEELKTNQQVIFSSIFKLAKGQAVTNNAIIDLYATIDSQNQLQKIGAAISDIQVDLSKNEWDKVELKQKLNSIQERKTSFPSPTIYHVGVS
jgi:chromosome segregation ATPase